MMTEIEVTPEEAKFARDEFVLTPHENNLGKFVQHDATEEDKQMAIRLQGVSPENFDKIIGAQKKQEVLKYRNGVKQEFLSLINQKEKKWAQATEVLTNYIKNELSIYTTKDDNKSEVWIYQDGIFIPQGRSEIKIILRDLLEEWYSQYVYGLVIAKIEADTFIDSAKFFSINYKEEVPVLNGVLNVLTGELQEFTPDKIFFNKLPVTFDPSAQCPKVDHFLSEVLSSEDDKNLFYEWAGFNLLNEYTFEKALMCVGDGRNGKDKMLELLKRMLGIQNCCSIPLASLEPDSFVISELFGKKANLAGDISGQDLKDLSMFKALTGRSLISGKRKFLRDITFVNSAKFTFACNQLPMVYDLSKGFWDRWLLLMFKFTFVTQQEYDAAVDKTNLKIRDEDIISKITTPQELSGFLNKCLFGLSNLYLNRSFSTSRDSEQVKEMWIRRSNSFIAFCTDRIEQDYQGKISKKDLRKEYSKFCKDHKLVVKSDMVIKRVLQDNYGVSESQYDSTMGVSGDRFWEGIAWKK